MCNTPKERNISRADIKAEFGWTDTMIRDFLPQPIKKANPHHSSAVPMQVWPISLVEQASKTEEVQRRLQKRNITRENRNKNKDEEKQRAIIAVTQYGIHNMIERAKTLQRKFHIHVGPTNSGKTHDAIETLKTCKSGVYLGPLRLLALEIFDTLNVSGCPCTLLTGEEMIETEFATVTASTIEMANFQKHYDVAVIDEAQMMADKSRGGHWTKAVLLIDATDVHVCAAPEILHILEELITRTGSEYEIIYHERLTPLRFLKEQFSYKKALRGDALITFSRKNVLSIAASLEKEGIRSSVIYGALPPAARREEVRKFTSGETSVVVATDAIGMGLSLPIRRIIFMETSKFDGTGRRPLYKSEIKQIAGRAGRYGKYDVGYVLTVADMKKFEQALDTAVPDIPSIFLPFPEDALDSNLPLEKLFDAWENLPQESFCKRQSLETERTLLQYMSKIVQAQSIRTQYSFVTCPVDTKIDFLNQYWHDCCDAIVKGEPIPDVNFPEQTLQQCETAYKAYDIRHQMLRRVGIEKSNEANRIRICNKINAILKTSKNTFARRCSCCGTPLPFNYRYGMCQKCYDNRYIYDYCFE